MLSNKWEAIGLQWLFSSRLYQLSVPLGLVVSTIVSKYLTPTLIPGVLVTRFFSDFNLLLLLIPSAGRSAT